MFCDTVDESDDENEISSLFFIFYIITKKISFFNIEMI